MATLVVNSLDVFGDERDVAVKAELTDLNGTPIAGHTADGVIVKPVTTRTEDGTVTLNLVPCADINDGAAGIYYTVTVGSFSFLIDKGAADDETIRDALADDPVALDSTALAGHLAAADPHTQYQLESGKGVANGYASLDGSGTVPDGQLPATLARDTEVSAAVTAHEAAADPHTGYQRESEKDQANGYPGLSASGKIDPDHVPTTTAAGLATADPLDGTENLLIEQGGDLVALGIDTAAAWIRGDGDQMQLFTTPGTHTWTKPAAETGCTIAHVFAQGAGGGGGSGRKGAAGSVRCGGGGGQGGQWVYRAIPLSALGATEEVVVGAGGAGGAAVTASNTNGNAGTDGGLSRFGAQSGVAALVIAPNGGGGGGGTNAAGAGGLNPLGAGGGGGAASGTGSTGGTASTSLTGSAAGGGAGGGITSGNSASAGGNGGGTLRELLGAAGGAANTAGAAGTARGADLGPGTGGGGGGGSTTGNGGAGGAGATIGGGGGGGGAATNAVGNSGAGGAGADGYVLVICA